MVALVLGGGDASVDPLGIMLAVASGAGYATYAVLAKRMLRLGHGLLTLAAPARRPPPRLASVAA